MNRFDADGFQNDRTNGATIPLPIYSTQGDLFNDRKLKKKRRNSIESTSTQDNVTPGRYKMNIICILSVVIVVLIAALCYTLVIIFEEKTHAIDDITDDILVKGLPSEQHVWHKIGINELRQSVKYEHNKNRAKNVILFVGDGMGISTVTATRIYKYGEEGALSWESFPHVGLLKVSVQCSFIEHKHAIHHLIIAKSTLLILVSSRHIVLTNKYVIQHQQQLLYLEVCSALWIHCVL